MITKSFFFFIFDVGKDIHFFYSFGFFAFFLSLAAKKKRSWLLCVYRAVYALFCNILTINCFFGCSAGVLQMLKIGWLCLHGRMIIRPYNAGKY